MNIKIIGIIELVACTVVVSVCPGLKFNTFSNGSAVPYPRCDQLAVFPDKIRIDF